MKRVAFAMVWTFVLTFVFLVLCCFVAGVVSAITLKGTPAQNDAFIKEASARWARPMFFGALVAAVGLSACGVLPGTRRRPEGTAAPSVPVGSDNSAGSDNPGDCDFPAARPTIAVPVGMPEDAPPELAALGPPLAVHGPGRLASMTIWQRFMIFVLGVALLVGPVAITNALDLDRDSLPNTAKIALVFGMLGSFLVCLMISVSPRSPYAYQVHRDALVCSDGKTMRIIPWDQIQALVPMVPFLSDLIVVTRDGQEVPIKGVRGYHDLVGTLSVQVRDHLLPLMIRRADAGRIVEFGPLGVSSDALRYKGATTPWDEVTKLLIVTGNGFHKLMIYHESGLGLWPFVQLNLDRVPNTLLLRELLRHVTPPRLLVSADQARW